MQPSWLDNKGGKYVLNDSKVNIIKSIFKHYLSGYGCVTIAKRLNREQAPVVVNAYKNRSNIWHPYQITRLLNNKALIGFYKTGINSEVGEYFPKAIPETDFYAVQAKLKENSKFKGQRNSSPYIFSHLIKCAFCGRTMFRTLEKGRSYLQCMGNKEGNCKAAYMHYAFLEKALLLVVGSQTVDLNDDNEVAAKKEIDEIKGRVAEITNKIKVASAMVAKRP